MQVGSEAFPLVQDAAPAAGMLQLCEVERAKQAASWRA